MTRPSPRWPGLRGLVLAAGGSQRLGQPKQVVRIKGRPLVRRTVQIVADVCEGPVTVVLGARSDQVAKCLEDMDVVRIDNPDWQSGLGQSLACGLAALNGHSRAVLVTPCDLPCLSKDDLETLAEAWSLEPDRPAAARYHGVVGTPAILPAGVFADLLEGRGDEGARGYLRRPGISVTPVDLAAAAVDLDREQDLNGIPGLSERNQET